MTQEQVLAVLIKIHVNYSADRRSNKASQFCTMWPMNDPPDTLMYTAPMEAVCEAIDMDIEEDYAAELFDMTLEEAAESLFVFMQAELDD